MKRNSLLALMVCLCGCATLQSPATTHNDARSDVTQWEPLTDQLRFLDTSAIPTTTSLVITITDQEGLGEQQPTGKVAEVLSNTVKFLSEHPAMGLKIAGHVSPSTNGAAAEVRRSEEKAQRLAQTFTRMGIAPGRVIVIGYGSRFPATPSVIGNNHQISNERVELTLQPLQ